jgi:hypothetical protein
MERKETEKKPMTIEIALMVLEDFQEYRLGKIDNFPQTIQMLTESINTILNYFNAEK